jgi:hypothetical protein
MDYIELSFKLVQTISVLIGVLVSVISLRTAVVKDAGARKAAAEARKVEAAKPFLEARLKLYTAALQSAAILATPEGREESQLVAARQRFWELYWGELCMVEDSRVEAAMCKMGEALRSAHERTPVQIASMGLAHEVRDSLLRSWGLRPAERVNDPILATADDPVSPTPMST